MLREGSGIIDDGDNSTWHDATRLDWRAVDRALRDIALRRAKLDAEEARWLREAERLQFWRPLGMVSAIDYLERVLGHTPHVANERLRVARALGVLPVLTDAFSRGELTFSAIRELTRVATRATETRWCDAAVGKNVRQVEELVAGHRRGDDPEDPPNPEVRTHVVRFDLGAEVFARLRQVRTTLTDERGSHLDDDQLVTALCDAVLDRASSSSSSRSEPTGRAKFQIAVTVCGRCDRASQEGAGAKLPIDGAALERARCDAQHIGSIDGDTPERASQDIPPSVVRFVWRRDGGRCQTPGCRSSTGLEIHHLVRRADGGSHDPVNLRLQCSSCHIALHRGTLAITCSESGRLETVRREEPRGGAGAAKLEATIVRTQARDALVGLGWKPSIARAAVDDAWSHVEPAAAVEVLIREALRRCHKPTV